MKKLDRSLGNTPTCLGNRSHTTHVWKSLNRRTGTPQIWIEIDKCQEKLCVYCESVAYKGETTGHIEHFFDKGTPAYKPLTFEWSNLFGCCSSTTHCGHYKDQILSEHAGVQIKRQYDSNLLLKPDVDDPEEYLQFLDNGQVKPKEGLDTDKNKRAVETIKALNLSSTELKIARKNQVTLYQDRLTPLLELLDTEDEDMWEEYNDLKEEAGNVPYRTAVKQAILWP